MTTTWADIPKARVYGDGGGGGGGAWPGPASVRGNDIFLGSVQDDYRGYTGFRLQELVAKKEMGWASAYVDWCFREMAANAMRWFVRWGNTGYCPETDPDFYDNFGKTLELCKQYGGYGHPVASCDQVPGSSVLTTDEKLADSVRRMCDVARQVGNCFPFEKENEPFKNGLKSRHWPGEWFHDLVWCPGTWNVSSNVNPNDEIGPWGPTQTVHPGGDREWVSEGGHLCYEVMRGGAHGLGDYASPQVPCLVGEPVRIAEDGRTAEQYAAHVWNCRNLGRGSCVHGGFWSLSSGTKHHRSDLQNCKAPTAADFPDALRTCEAVRDVWRSPLWAKNSSSQGAYVRAAVAEKGVPGFVPGVGDTLVFPQTDGECPLTHWDRWIDAQGVEYEDLRGSGRTYFARLPDGTMTGGPLDMARDCRPEARLGYHVAAQDGPIWVMKK